MRLILCLALILLGAGPAAAHAVLTGVEPAQGAILDRQPEQVVLHFMQPVTVLRTELIDPASRTVALSDVQASGNEVLVPLPAGLDRGTYLLRWRVLGGDPHPVAGMLTFSMHQPSETPAVPASDDAPVEWAIWAVQMMLNSCLLVGMGGVFFRFWLHDGEPLPALARRGIVAALWLSAPAVVIFGLLSAVQAVGASWSVLRDVSAVLHVLWLTGGLLKAGLVAAAIAVCVWLTPRAPLWTGRLASGAAVVLASAALALEGHGAPGVSALAARAVLFSHVVSLMFWVGALLPLGNLLLKGTASEALARFSQVIPAFLALLVLSGLAMVLLHVGSVAQLFLSDFGLVLLIKLLMFGGLLAIAAHNRFRLTPRVSGGDRGAARVLASFAGVEVGLILLIISAAGFWRFAPPVLSAGAAEGPILAEVGSPGLTAMVSLSPGFEVPRDLSLTLQQDGGQSVIRAITLTAAPANGAVPAIQRSLAPTDGGEWAARGLYLSTPGPWQFDFAVAQDGGSPLKLSATVFVTR